VNDSPTIESRKKQIMELVAHGLPSVEIAEMLGLSDHTVKTYTSWIIKDHYALNRTDISRIYWQGQMKEAADRLNQVWIRKLVEAGVPNAADMAFDVMKTFEKQEGVRPAWSPTQEGSLSLARSS
jgi:DNA-binding CsgD family transcriptional regulator